GLENLLRGVLEDHALPGDEHIIATTDLHDVGVAHDRPKPGIVGVFQHHRLGRRGPRPGPPGAQDREVVAPFGGRGRPERPRGHVDLVVRWLRCRESHGYFLVALAYWSQSLAGLSGNRVACAGRRITGTVCDF